ncbi:MAG: hypothetical protein BWY78_00116 [Alphaproteobacteria bacterium ADurb.Bin438]|nr:MAG: hypothetical protein BWY78_00116 [Alphaproteobacteria bacterium ADurb.Bin438]
MENETHYTCDVIDGIIKFADEKLEKDKNFFDKMSIKELSTLSLSLVNQSKLSYDSFKDIAKSIIKEENDGNASYNSYLSHVKDAKCDITENPNKRPSIILDEYKKHLKNESKKIDCNNFTVSFIDFINHEKAELLKNDSPIRFNETLDSDYVFKSDKVMAFVVLNSFIENDGKEIKPTCDNFVKETNKYYQNMNKLIKDIQNDKVSSESLNHFKKAINHYYKSFQISNQLNTDEITSENLKQEITKTLANPIPKEMEKMFFNDKASLNNILEQKANFEKNFIAPQIVLNKNQKSL